MPLLGFLLLLAAAITLGHITAAEASPLGTLTLVTAAQGGLLKTVGPLNPHGYRPNEFVVQNWVYDGLVHYAKGGRIKPALAESWRIEPKGMGQDIIFNLRRGVRFHDGEPWNAAACKANFDQVMVEPLVSGYHGWYELPSKITGWEVVDEFTFRLSFSERYYPALQELSLIRPMRFISPRSLPTSPGEKSCPSNAPLFWPTNVTEFECVGIKSPQGTGPLIFESLTTGDGRNITSGTFAGTNLTDVPIRQLRFKVNKNYWDVPATGNLDAVVVQLYETLEEVGEAVRKGEVDMVFGLDTVDPQLFRSLHSNENDNVETFISGPLNTRLVQLNSGRSPTSSLAVRKAIAHAINKQAIIRNELAGLEQPAYQVFSRSLPYCDVDLSPLLGYDREKSLALLEAAGWRLPPGGRVRERNGTRLEVEFLYKSSSSIHVAIEDDIRADLAAIGIAVKPVVVDAQDKFNQLNSDGKWDLAFSEAFGPPYDPQSFASNFQTWGGYTAGMAGLSDSPVTEGFTLAVPADNETLYSMIDRVLVSTDEAKRQQQWADILTVLHEQVVFVPISFLVNVAILNDRYENFEFGGQQWDVPVHRVIDRALLAEQTAQSGSQGGLSAGAIAAIVVCSVLAVLSFAAVVVLIVRERKGRPMFQPLLDDHGAPNEEAPTKDAEMAVM